MRHKEVMNLSEIELPSNRKFGFFCTAVFLTAGSYFYLVDISSTSYALLVLGFLFFIVTILNADLLLTLNKLWMRFGLLLGMIISPIVLGVIFFGLFTPISQITRLTGRDELRLRFNKKPSYWIIREASQAKSGNFKNQF